MRSPSRLFSARFAAFALPLNSGSHFFFLIQMPEVPSAPTGLDMRLLAGAVAVLVILAGVFVFILPGASSPQGPTAVPSATPSPIPSASVAAPQGGAPTSTPFATATPSGASVVTPPPGRCYASGGADDYSHHGYVLGGTGPICVPRGCEDACSGPTTLVKWYCNGDVPASKTVECNGPCANGACPPEREPE